jgi:hypothetical protein
MANDSESPSAEVDADDVQSDTYDVSDFEPGYSTEPYNPEPDRERVRGWMAFGLIGLFAVEVIFLLIAVSAGWITSAEAMDLGSLVLSPTIGLAGAATGFYYATRNR